MQHTVLLSQVFGIYLIIVGTTILVRRRYFLPVFAAFVQERLTRAVVSFAEILGALFLIMTHSVWSSLPAGIISALGWIAVVEGTAYLALPDELLDTCIRTFNTPSWYLFGGVLSVAIGVYLTVHGFGFFVWP